MDDDFFMGFAAHAHTLNELETDQQRESELRRKNRPEEAKRLTEVALSKLENGILESSYSLEDVKLLIQCRSIGKVHKKSHRRDYAGEMIE